MTAERKPRWGGDSPDLATVAIERATCGVCGESTALALSLAVASLGPVDREVVVRRALLMAGWRRAWFGAAGRGWLCPRRTIDHAYQTAPVDLADLRPDIA